MTEENDKDILSAYLLIAKEKLLSHIYPYSYEDDMEVPHKYDGLHVEIAAYFINKRGAEGEVSHAENGVSRTYADADIPANMLRRIVPMASVLKKKGVINEADEQE